MVDRIRAKRLIGLARNPHTVEFLNQLESAYSLMRFGEAGYQLSFLPFRDRLDGVAFLCAKPTSTESVLHTLARI